MIVEVGVGCANKVFGDGVTEEDTEDSVFDSECLVFVEGEEDEGVFHEVLVG